MSRNGNYTEASQWGDEEPLSTHAAMEALRLHEEFLLQESEGGVVEQEIEEDGGIDFSEREGESSSRVSVSRSLHLSGGKNSSSEETRAGTGTGSENDSSYRLLGSTKPAASLTEEELSLGTDPFLERALSCDSEYSVKSIEEIKQEMRLSNKNFSKILEKNQEIQEQKELESALQVREPLSIVNMYRYGYISISCLSQSILSCALESPYLLQSYPIQSLASHPAIILTSTIQPP